MRKPGKVLRLPAALQTPEDDRIWADVSRRLARRWGLVSYTYILDLAVQANRRDASLMYRLTQTRTQVDAVMLTNEPFRATIHSLLESGVEL